MKDLPHHMKKLNRKVIRSTHREEKEEETYDVAPPLPSRAERPIGQLKKQAKAKLRKERMARTPTPLTPEEREKKLAARVPVFDRINKAKPKVAKPTQKKTPRI